MLARHVDFALALYRRHRHELSGMMRKHQLKLPDRQCRIAEVSGRIQDTVLILVAALWAHRQNSEPVTAATDVLCEDLRRKLTGERPSDGYFRKIRRLAETIIDGGYEALAAAPRMDILMKYDNE